MGSVTWASFRRWYLAFIAAAAEVVLVRTGEIMITYEITATVRDDLIDAYERYMRDRHIPDLMGTGSFAGASLSRSSPGCYRIRYEVRGREELDEYLAKHAPRLRRHFTETFPSGVELSRYDPVVHVRRPPAKIRHPVRPGRQAV